jgi:hypothetical protein
VRIKTAKLEAYVNLKPFVTAAVQLQDNLSDTEIWQFWKSLPPYWLIMLR